MEGTSLNSELYLFIYAYDSLPVGDRPVRVHVILFIANFLIQICVINAHVPHPLLNQHRSACYYNRSPYIHLK